MKKSKSTAQANQINPLLSGVRVLDLSRLLPGPFCSQYLAQLGAEVIKIEEPNGGDYARALPEMFSQVNRGKKSVTLDLRLAKDLATFKQLVETADVVLESFRPGVMDKLGCGYETLREINPKLVYAALTGYGQTGPYKDWAGHDMNYLSIAGVLDQIGVSGGPPAQSNLQIADLAGGSLTCAIGILAALLGARASGVGSLVDVSMTDGAAALQVMALTTLRDHGKTFPRGRDLLSGATPNYAVYKCLDGKYLAVGALEPKFLMQLLKGLWSTSPGPLQTAVSKLVATTTGKRKNKRKGTGQSTASKPEKKASFEEQLKSLGRLGEAMQDPEKARRLMAPLRLTLKTLFRTRSRAYWTRLLADIDACVTPVLTLEEALQNEHLLARGVIVEDGGKPAFNLPIQFSHAKAQGGSSPNLGADNEAVLGNTRTSVS